MPFAESLRDALPIQTELFALHLVDPTTDYRTGSPAPGICELPGGDTRVTIRLFVHERVDGEPQVRDIKEQEVILLKGKHRHDPRLDAYVAGWRDAVLEVFTQQEELRKRDPAAFDRFEGAIDRLMPHDLCAPGILDLKRPRDAAAFADALLASKKWFGGFLP